MTENTLQIVSALKIVWLAGVAYLYGRGGISGKHIRRIFAPLFLVLGIVLFSLWQGSFQWLCLLSLPLLYAVFTIGYGVNSRLVKFWEKFTSDPFPKLLTRLVAGSAYALASLPIAFAGGAWLLFYLHIVLCIFVVVILGVYNPTSARAEETIIGATVGFLPLYFIG